jgi:hypothetical protein
MLNIYYNNLFAIRFQKQINVFDHPDSNKNTKKAKEVQL